MAKAKKLQKEELSKINSVVSRMNQLKINLADLDLQKTQLYKVFEQFSEELANEQKTLEEKYGDVTIDLSSGEIKDNERSDS